MENTTINKNGVVDVISSKIPFTIEIIVNTGIKIE